MKKKEKAMKSEEEREEREEGMEEEDLKMEGEVPGKFCWIQSHFIFFAFSLFSLSLWSLRDPFSTTFLPNTKKT